MNPTLHIHRRLSFATAWRAVRRRGGIGIGGRAMCTPCAKAHAAVGPLD